MRSNKTTARLQLDRFKALSRKFNLLLSSGRIEQLEANERHRLVDRILRLYRALQQAYTARRLRRILAAGALFLGIQATGTAQAQTFNAPLANPFGLVQMSEYCFPEYADIDGDGDLDLFVTGDSTEIKFYENVGSASSPLFAVPTNNPFNVGPFGGYATFQTFADMDNDGDLDVFTGNYYGTFSYQENLGTAMAPNFGPVQINPFGLDSTYNFNIPEAVDLDDDGDYDLLVTEYYGRFQYFENTGTASAPAFAAPVMNPFGLTSHPYFILPTIGDLDQDGDFDILAGDYYGQYRYFENVGTAQAASFAAPVVNPWGFTADTVYHSPCFGDLDGDGDLDIMVGVGYDPGDFHYYENTTPVGKEISFGTPKLEIAPNPVSDVLNLEASLEGLVGEMRIDILDLRGAILSTELVEAPDAQWKWQKQVEDLSPGLYFVRIRHDKTEIKKRFVIQR